MKRRDFIEKSMATAILSGLSANLLSAKEKVENRHEGNTNWTGFQMLPAPVDGGFKPFTHEGVDYNIWCGSVIEGEDNRYHMFASAIPRRKGSSWVWDSIVVRAVSDNLC